MNKCKSLKLSKKEIDHIINPLGRQVNACLNGVSKELILSLEGAMALINAIARTSGIEVQNMDYFGKRLSEYKRSAYSGVILNMSAEDHKCALDVWWALSWMLENCKFEDVKRAYISVVGKAGAK